MTRFLLVSSLLCSSVALADLSPVATEELGDITGANGVALSLEMRLNADANGTTQCGSTVDIKSCRLGLSFNNRYISGSYSEWLVAKGFSGVIYIPYMALDADAVTYTSDGGGGVASGTTVTQPAAKITFGGSANKVRVKNLKIDNLAVEYDTGTAVSALGYMTTSESGFMGIRISDTTNNVGIEVSGTVKMFACTGSHPKC